MKIYEPDALGSDLSQPSLGPAAPEPTVDGLPVRSYSIGIFLEGHFAVVPPGDIIRPDRACRAKPTPLEQAMDHSSVEAILLGRCPALSIERVSDNLRGCSLASQVDYPGKQLVEVLQLLEPPDRSCERMFRHSATHPMADESSALGFTHDDDFDAFQHHTRNGLAIARRR